MPGHEIREGFDLTRRFHSAQTSHRSDLCQFAGHSENQVGPRNRGTNHFAHAGSPADKARVAEYEAGPYKGFADEVRAGFASIVPADADVAAVADAIVKVVDTPFGKRPLRVHIDPTHDGAEVVNMVSDRVRAELLRRIGLGDLLTPRDVAVELQSAA